MVGEVWGGTGGRCPGGKASYREGPPRVPRQKCVTSVYIAFACVITRHELVALVAHRNGRLNVRYFYPVRLQQSVRLQPSQSLLQKRRYRKDTHSQHGARGARDGGIRCRAGAGRRDGRHVQLHLLLQQQVLPARTWNLLVPRFVPGCDIANPNANQVRYRPARDAPIGRESQRDRRRLGRSHVRPIPLL